MDPKSIILNQKLEVGCKCQLILMTTKVWNHWCKLIRMNNNVYSQYTILYPNYGFGLYLFIYEYGLMPIKKKITNIQPLSSLCFDPCIKQEAVLRKQKCSFSWNGTFFVSKLAYNGVHIIPGCNNDVLLSREETSDLILLQSLLNCSLQLWINEWGEKTPMYVGCPLNERSIYILWYHIAHKQNNSLN